jgi:hypothetical protein
MRDLEEIDRLLLQVDDRGARIVRRSQRGQELRVQPTLAGLAL